MKNYILLFLPFAMAACGGDSSNGDVNSTTDAFTSSPDSTAVADVSTADVGLPPAEDVIISPEEVSTPPDASTTVDVPVAPIEDVGAPDVAPPVVEDVGGGPSVEDIESTPDAVPEPTTLGGGILVFELASDFLSQAGAGARFTPPATEDAQDTPTTYGPCVVSVADPDAPPDPALFGYDAGEITINGTVPAATLTPVDEGADGTGYESNLAEDLESLLPGGGALLTVSGAGGADIPAFDLYIQVPEPVTLESPATGIIFESVNTSTDLTVTWNAGNGDAILVTLTPLSATFQPIPGHGLICSQEGDLGSMVVPAAALGDVKSSGVNKVAIGVTRILTSATNTGPWKVPVVLTRSTGGPVGLD